MEGKQARDGKPHDSRGKLTTILVMLTTTLIQYMLQYVRRLQGNSKVKGSSLTITIPYPLTQVLELTKSDNILLELAKDKNEKVIVIRKLQTEIKEDPKYKINVVT